MKTVNTIEITKTELVQAIRFDNDLFNQAFDKRLFETLSKVREILSVRLTTDYLDNDFAYRVILENDKNEHIILLHTRYYSEFRLWGLFLDNLKKSKVDGKFYTELEFCLDDIEFCQNEFRNELSIKLPISRTSKYFRLTDSYVKITPSTDPEK